MELRTNRQALVIPTYSTPARIQVHLALGRLGLDPPVRVNLVLGHRVQVLRALARLGLAHLAWALQARVL